MSKLARIGGRYRLHARVGKGDLGVLWAAVDERSGLPVAVRILQRGLDDPRRVARFRASALASARLDHPHIVKVLDEGIDDQGPFIVSEWVEATPLAAWLGRAPAWGFLKAVMTQICDALAYVHACGLVHLDLRPRNVLVCHTAAGPDVRLVDVGCGRIDDGWGDRQVGAPATLKYLGTLRYLAPEVAEAPPWQAGPWSDLYSVGLILWELLTGSIPFDHLDGVALLLHRATRDVPPLPEGVAGPERRGIALLLERLLARAPADRPRSAAQVRRTLAGMPGAPCWSAPARITTVQLPSGDPRRALAAGFPLRALHAGPLVGRDGALDRVWRGLHAVVSGGGGRLILLEGPPAAGKGRVVEAVARHAAARGVARTWTVRFHEGGGPGAGLLGAMEVLLKAGATDRDGVAARVAALPLLEGIEPEGLDVALPALLHPAAPGFARPGGFVEPGAAIGGVDAAHAAAAVFLQLVRRAARTDAILLWLDDAHLAPRDELLAVVGRTLEATDLPVCVVATGRQGAPAMRALCEAHPEGPSVEHLTLSPLGVDESRAYLRARLGLAPMAEQQVLSVVHQRPALLEGISGFLLDGHLVPAPDGNTLLPGTVLPESEAEIWRHQLGRLPGQGADTLVADVVAGLALSRVPLSPRVVEALAADDPALPVDRTLAAGERARLLVGDPTGGWRFVSQELAAWLVRGFAERTTRWHAIWLRTLERLEGRARGRFGVERAWHAEALGQEDAAISALLDSARWALGPGQQAWARGLEAARRARTLAQHARDPVRAGRAERLRAEILREAGRPVEARAALDALERQLMIPPARTERAWCAFDRALLDLDEGRLDHAERGFDEAEGLFAEESDAAGGLWALLARGHLADRRGVYRLARTCGRDAERGFEAMGQTRGRLAARQLRAMAAEAAGDLETADGRYAGLMSLADERRWLLDATRLRLRRIRVLLELGQAGAALALLEAAGGVAEVSGLGGASDWLAAVRPAVLAAAGEPDAARMALRAARLPTILVPEAVATLEAALAVVLEPEALRARLQLWVEQVRGG